MRLAILAGMNAPPTPRLRAVDLNLLTVLDAVLNERNVTRAAERLGMTQPAVSNALTRLRLLFLSLIHI